jgi:photosystem II stability/assembly factor-like uncharacterized protein
LFVACAFVPAASLEGQSVATTLDDAKWRHIGPAAFGGRISDLAVDPTNPAVIYVGAASGGVFKSINGGTSWQPVFDNSGGAQSIGAIAIAPSDPQVVWVGTGEANNRQSSSWGNGVYRSVDGGRTWVSLGLADTHHIGRIVVHPTNPDVAYVAALGHLWGANEARGVYRTRDGGKTWKKVLSIDAQTGVVDITLDRDGRTLIAGAYQRQRKAFGFVGGGKGSGIYRSTDGGDNWSRMSDGLPSGDIGRIGLAQSHSQPEIVYAIVEHRTAGGVYRSEDRGISWKKMNPLNPRPMYYSQLRVDPTNADRVWMLDAYLFRSIDGGKTFSSDSTGEGIHVDHHAMWIDPSNPGHMVLGNDGGLYITRDYARSWRYIDNLPIGQYYDISVDDQEPYYIYGGLQDNGTWALPSRTFRQGGIFNTDIINLATGDGFYTTPDPANPKYVYANSQNGRAYSVNVETGEQQLIRPVSSDTAVTHSFGWATPMLVSPHDSRTYYYGGERLFRTHDRGKSWQPVSPDMSRNKKWRSAPIMGVVRDSTTLSRDDGVSDYGTLTSISESPKRAGVLLVGTDEGVVQLSMDAGATWTDITSRFRLPAQRWVSRVIASEHDAQTMYVAFDGHQDDDFKAYLFRTSDGGKTWTNITAGVPAGYVINAVAEHPDNANVLLVGTEQGLLVTYDGGRGWKRAAGNLPTVPIDDIVVQRKTRDIVLGTHGRSLIVLDDSRMMASGDPATGATRLIAPGIATMSYARRALPAAGGARFSGDNPADGALLTYIVGRDAAASKSDSAVITVHGADGGVVRELKGPATPGVHRVAWDLRRALPYTPVAADAVWFGPPKGAWVTPGAYTISMRVGAVTQKASLDVRGDARAGATEQDYSARHVAGLKVHEMLRAWNDADSALKNLDAVLATRPAGDSVTVAQKAKVADLHERFRSGWLSMKSRVIDLHGAIQSATAAPTDAQARALEMLQAEMKREVADLNQAIAAISGPGSKAVASPSDGAQ